jgi:hypothetical protein
MNKSAKFVYTSFHSCFSRILISYVDIDRDNIFENSSSRSFNLYAGGYNLSSNKYHRSSNLTSN